MAELSQKMNSTVSKQAISKYENGQMAPSSETLIELASALDTDINYFFRPISPDLQNLKVSFRKKSNINRSDVKALEINIHDDIERFLEIESIIGQETSSVVALDVDETLSDSVQMREQAIKLREQWKLGEMPIMNIQDTLETNGIKVIFYDGPDGFDGVSGVVNQNSMIVVLNSNVKNVERQRFTAMHELGHLLFNDYFDKTLSNHNKELLCHAFASEMLLPSSALEKIFSESRAIYFKELVFVQKQYGISIDAIMHKLNDLGIINGSRYRSYNIKKNTDANFKVLTEETRFQETKTPRFEAMVYGALASELITESKAASLLKTTVEEVHKTIQFV